jgi:hypothetical protein
MVCTTSLERIYVMQDAKTKIISRALGVFVALVMLISAVGFLLVSPHIANAHFSPQAKNHAVTGGAGATLPYVENMPVSFVTNLRQLCDVIHRASTTLPCHRDQCIST